MLGTLAPEKVTGHFLSSPAGCEPEVFNLTSRTEKQKFYRTRCPPAAKAQHNGGGQSHPAPDFNAGFQDGSVRGKDKRRGGAAARPHPQRIERGSGPRAPLPEPETGMRKGASRRERGSHPPGRAISPGCGVGFDVEPSRRDPAAVR